MNKRALILAFVALLAAQTAAESPADRPSPLEVKRDATRFLIDGTPTPLLFARGPVREEDYDAYKDTGFNALVFAVRDPSDEAIADLDVQIRKAQAKGFFLILALAPKSLPPMSPRGETYRTAVRDFIHEVGKLRAYPRLVAWMVEAVPSDGVPEFDADFIGYLTDTYTTLDALNEAWGSEFENWRQATPAAATAQDAQKPGGIGRALVDLARSRRETYRDLLTIWANEVRIADPVHPILAGAVRDFRAVISIPSDYAGVVEELQPNLAGGDTATHNVHGVDMGRRGGRMAPLPILATRALPAELTDWMRLMALHGACGIGFDAWSDLVLNEPRRRAIRAAVDSLTGDGLLPLRPVPALAVLYEPFQPGPGDKTRGSYGYLPSAFPGPAALFTLLGRGTRYGLVDYLSQEDLTRVSLDPYALLIAPQAYSLTLIERQAVLAFVGRGGRLMADLGFGFDEAGDNVGEMPADLRELFGLPLAYTVQTANTNFWTWGNQQFADLGVGLPAHGNGPEGQPFSGPVAFYNLPYPDLLVLGAQQMGIVFSGILVSPPRGTGLAVFGMTWLWQYWLPGDPVFDALHMDLIGLNVRSMLLTPTAFVSNVIFTPLSDGRLVLWNPGGESVEVVARDPKLYRCASLLQETPVGDQAAQRLIFPGQRLWVATPMPVSLTSETPARVEVVEYSPERVRLRVFGTGSTVQWTADGWTPAGGDFTKFTLTVRDGDYKVPTGSVQRIAWQRRRNGAWEEAEVTAPGPLLKQEFRSRAGEVVVEPVAKPN